jgi:hypothetical protein
MKMPEPYDLTNITNSNNFYELMVASNNLSEGLLGILILISIFILIYVLSSRFGARTAFATSSFLTAGFAILLRVMLLINDTFLFGSILLVAIAYIWMKLGG